MRFKLGFITGIITGYAVARFLTPSQKEKIDGAVASLRQNERVDQVTGVLVRQGAQLADSVTAKATRLVEYAGDRGRSGPGDGANGEPRLGSADREPTAPESIAAERAAAKAPDVGATYDEMARRGAETQGEGRVP